VILIFRSTMAAAVVIVLSSAAKAGPGIAGEGLSSCGSWTEAREQRAPYQTDIKLQWVFGYLSAINGTGVLSKEFLLDNADAPGIFRAMDKYCREHPLVTVEETAIDVAKQLAAHANNKR
jgi:hypothetical protein